MEKAPECFGGFKFELTEEERKEYENNRRIMKEAESEYIKATTYGHGGSVEDRKKNFGTHLISCLMAVMMSL